MHTTVQINIKYFNFEKVERKERKEYGTEERNEEWKKVRRKDKRKGIFNEIFFSYTVQYSSRKERGTHKS